MHENPGSCTSQAVIAKRGVVMSGDSRPQGAQASGPRCRPKAPVGCRRTPVGMPKPLLLLKSPDSSQAESERYSQGRLTDVANNRRGKDMPRRLLPRR